MNNLEIRKVNNGFIVFEQQPIERGYSMPQKIWVAYSPKELAILIEDLAEKGSSE